MSGLERFGAIGSALSNRNFAIYTAGNIPSVIGVRSLKSGIGISGWWSGPVQVRRTLASRLGPRMRLSLVGGFGDRQVWQGVVIGDEAGVAHALEMYGHNA